MSSASTMRAAIAGGPREISVAEVPVPEPGPGEVRVRVGACGVCGSDLHFFELGALPAGVIPGHEIAGVIESSGPGVRTLSPGDAVAIEPLESCGACPSCRAGRDSICPDVKLLGLRKNGGFAEYVVAPERRLFRVPAELDVRLAALAEPLAVVVHGLRRGGFEPGQRVLVVGAGTVGLLAVFAARALGAGEVVCTARHAHQADLARTLGAARVLGEAEAGAFALAELGTRTPVDLALETVGGRADTLSLCTAAIRPGGTISVLGVFTQPVPVDPFALLVKEGTLAWSNCYARGERRADFDDAVALLGDERERLARVATHELPLDEIARAFALAADKRAGVIKVHVRP